MKFKLDENLGALGKDLLEGAGHEVTTVVEQGLAGASDIAICGYLSNADRRAAS